MILKFEGKVELGDECRCSDDPSGAILIAGRDAVGEIYDADFSGPVTVAIADSRFTGDLSVDLGDGYTEWTPMDPDKLMVGPHNLIDALRHFAEAGESVTMWIADEPVNVLDWEAVV